MNLIEQKEWLKSAKDTNWSVLMDEDKGPLTKRFCNAFYCELGDHVQNYQTMAKTLYKELSESIHGNEPNLIPITDSFEFNENVFNVWHEKAVTVKFIIQFCLVSRYLKQIHGEELEKLETAVIDALGHVEAVRIVFGGVATNE